MTAVLLALSAGALLGALAVAVRWGIGRVPDSQTGALAAAAVGATVAAATAAPSAANSLHANSLWPFLVAGLVAPGASQLVLTLAVRDAGPSRAAVLMGTTPFISILLAIALLGEPLRLPVVAGTALIVSGGVALARERDRPEHFRTRGIVLALVCAGLFASRDNIVRWGARDTHPPPLLAAAASLVAATTLLLAHALLSRRGRMSRDLARALPAFAPAGLCLGLGYDTLLAAFDRGRVGIVSPLSATGSLWAVVLAAALFPRSEQVARRTLIAAALVVAGGALVGSAG